MQMLNKIKNDPMSILSQYGIPQNIANNPEKVTQYLMKNGKITQNQYNDAVQQANSMRSFFGMKS
jgi:hypothetical protein